MDDSVSGQQSSRQSVRSASAMLSQLIFMSFALLNFIGQGSAAEVKFDHLYIIVLENHGFDNALFGPAPVLRSLAQTQGLATYYFGVSHPSLPNYLAMIGGDDFGVRDDNPSCFASDLQTGQKCHGFDDDSLVDQLDSRGLTWAYYAQDLPGRGSLVIASPNINHALYAQKHNPFAYFSKIAKSATRLQNIRPFSAFDADLRTDPPALSFIVPNQCNDGHGLDICADPTNLVKRFDQFIAITVEKIRTSPKWSERSAIVITFDEGEPPLQLSESPQFVDCCGNGNGALGGHHLATVVVSKCGRPMRSAKALNHYSLLATIEDGFGLARLKKASGAETLNDLLGGSC